LIQERALTVATGPRRASSSSNPLSRTAGCSTVRPILLAGGGAHKPVPASTTRTRHAASGDGDEAPRAARGLRGIGAILLGDMLAGD
jgi:hypothetical protein